MPFRILTAAILVALCVAAAPASAANPPDSLPLGPLPRDVVPEHYRLAFTIDPTKPRFSGRDEIDVNFVQPRHSIFLHGKDLDVHAALLRLPSGETIGAHYEQVHESGLARLSFDREVPAGRATLIFDYDAALGASLSGLYKVVDGGDDYAFTQFEASDARRAFPSFDEPGFKTPFDISIAAPTADKVVSNTPVLATAAAGEGLTRTSFEATRPLPTYLVALAVGPLDIVDGGDIPANSLRARPVHLRGIAAKGKGEQLRFALSFTPRVVIALEDYFGIAYPFPKLDIIAVPDFAAGAMENAGAITFRERLVLMDGRAPLEQKRLGLAVQAHEIAHQWFGDLVTPRWWDDTWLNESFANWMENKIAGTVRSDWDFSRDTLRAGLAVMTLDELPSARAIHQPIANSGDIENSFDGITYNKGAAVLSMFENYLGADVFRAGISAYLRKFSSGNATAQDFIETVAKAAGHPETIGALRDFIDQPGIPKLETTLKCRASAAEIRVARSMYVPIGRTPVSRAWRVPMCVSAPGRPKTCALVDSPGRIVRLAGRCPAYVFPNAEGGGYYRFDIGTSSWRTLIEATPGLDAAEQLTLSSNIAAAFRAGRASAADFVAAVAALAPVAKWDLVSAIHDTLHGFDQDILRPEDRPALRTFVRARFAQRFQSMSYRGARMAEPAGIALLRAQLATLLVEEGRDPQVTSALVPAARAYLASDGLDTNGMSRELMQEGMRAGVLGGGTAFEDALVDAFLKSGKQYLRQQMIAAAGATENAAFADRWLSLVPKMRSGELITLMRSGPEDAVMRTRIWAWVKANYGTLVQRLPPQALAATPAVLGHACDAASRADLDGFFRPRLASLPGMARPLALAEEQIDRCMAFKAARANELAAAVSASK
ncbi:MAG TPA: M1 family metallopeptidase [Rhizomicrobium sp.]|jgi:alanyl aminopeptidase